MSVYENIGNGKLAMRTTNDGEGSGLYVNLGGGKFAMRVKQEGDAIPDGSITTDKIADEAVTDKKLSPDIMTKINRALPIYVKERSTDPNTFLDEGLYTANGTRGQVAGNMPTTSSAWTIWVTETDPSNGYICQHYVSDHGVYYRFSEGGKKWSDDWVPVIIDGYGPVMKSGELSEINPIADPSAATTEDIANAYNELLAALKG